MGNLYFTSELNSLPLPLKLSRNIDEISGTLKIFISQRIWENLEELLRIVNCPLHPLIREPRLDFGK